MDTNVHASASYQGISTNATDAQPKTLTASSDNSNKADSTTIGVRIINPFVTKEKDRYGGFSIELWENIRQKSGISPSFVKEYSTVGELVDGVSKKEVDVGIAAISITSERESKVDFSQPMFDSGLQIGVPSKNMLLSSNFNIFEQLAKVIWNSNFGYMVLGILLLSLIPAHNVYVIEGLREHGIFSRNYFPGIFESYRWTLNALASQSETALSTNSGKFVTTLWMYFSVIFIALFTASITTDLTTQRLVGSINSISDLAGKKVISVESSTASKYLTSKNIVHDTTKSVDEAFPQIVSGEYEAIVYDAPALSYFAKNKGNGKFNVVGDIFVPENYGIALPQDSLYRSRINLALLQMKEDGSYDELVKKWFGEKK